MKNATWQCHLCCDRAVAFWRKLIAPSEQQKVQVRIISRRLNCLLTSPHVDLFYRVQQRRITMESSRARNMKLKSSSHTPKKQIFRRRHTPRHVCCKLLSLLQVLNSLRYFVNNYCLVNLCFFLVQRSSLIRS